MSSSKKRSLNSFPKEALVRFIREDSLLDVRYAVSRLESYEQDSIKAESQKEIKALEKLIQQIWKCSLARHEVISALEAMAKRLSETSGEPII